jgi:glyoxylase-like metal-dependent hydrolase (beta-lactamase superfamily II)
MPSDRHEKNLAATGLTVNDINFVICTHVHVDRSAGTQGCIPSLACARTMIVSRRGIAVGTGQQAVRHIDAALHWALSVAIKGWLTRWGDGFRYHPS